MFHAVESGLTLSKILGGTSKFLGIINQALPIYKEIKPMIGNFKNVISVVREFNNTNKQNTKTTIDIKEKTVNDNYLQSSTNPVFFQ